MGLRVVTGWIVFVWPLVQQQLPYDGMEEASLLICRIRAREREPAVGVPTLHDVDVIKGGEEYVKDSHIHEAWDRTEEQVFAFCIRELAQEQVYEVFADRFIRSDVGRDLELFNNPLKVSWQECVPPRLGLQHRVCGKGKKEGKPMSDSIDGLHKLGRLRKRLGVLPFAKLHQVAVGILRSKITEPQRQVDVLEPQKASLRWQASLPVRIELLHPLLHTVFILGDGSLKRQGRFFLRQVRQWVSTPHDEQEGIGVSLLAWLGHQDL